jgi:hypothetical protein
MVLIPIVLLVAIFEILHQYGKKGDQRTRQAIRVKGASD